MRFITYSLAAFLAASTVLGSAIPNDAENEIVTLSDTDLEPIPEGEVDIDGEEDVDDGDDDDNNGLEKRWPWDKKCTPKVCKKGGKCFKVNTKIGRCINLKSSDGKPFVRSSSPGGCECIVYSKKGCPFFAGDKEGFTMPWKFSFNAKSIECNMGGG